VNREVFITCTASEAVLGPDEVRDKLGCLVAERVNTAGLLGGGVIVAARAEHLGLPPRQ
jgi:hypothetical protein